MFSTQRFAHCNVSPVRVPHISCHMAWIWGRHVISYGRGVRLMDGHIHGDCWYYVRPVILLRVGKIPLFGPFYHTWHWLTEVWSYVCGLARHFNYMFVWGKMGEFSLYPPITTPAALLKKVRGNKIYLLGGGIHRYRKSWDVSKGRSRPISFYGVVQGHQGDFSLQGFSGVVFPAVPNFLILFCFYMECRNKISLCLLV